MLYFIVGKEPNEQEFPWHVGGNIPRLGKVDSIYADGHELEHLQRLGFALNAYGNVKLFGHRANSALRAMRLHASSKTETPAPMIGLGDVVTFSWNDGVYSSATVTQVHKDGTVDLLRPYVHTSDVSYSGRREGSSSLLAYLGFEEIKDLNPERLTLVRKAPVPK